MDNDRTSPESRIASCGIVQLFIIYSRVPRGTEPQVALELSRYYNRRRRRINGTLLPAIKRGGTVAERNLFQGMTTREPGRARREA